ncbi:cupin domain-containing protein [Aliikangiella coralliicola]|uniref:Cupin domain-containing protein n=1 Tax=Aliikangiella coralliicola TaxID=2592383 RepID=A0A545UC27_9GAMM|nr:cupin domain-containing protein [Aliikangiella coralliicola]TQV87016.1 cupin domain-containing protein [Aliikangiella coralliicola]
MSETKSITSLESLELQTRGDGGKFEFGYARLGAEIGLKKLGCGLFVLPPGKCTFPYHAHSTIEEMHIILEGEGTIRHNDKEYSVKAGDVVASNVGDAHQLTNTSDKDLRYLVVSNNENIDVVHYPDSDKILAMSDILGNPLVHITHRNAGTDYYDGESE